MRLKHLFIVHAAAALFFGVVLVLIPKSFLSLYDISLTTPGAEYIARIFGAALLIYTFVGWFARDAEDSVARRAIVLGFFLTEVLGFILSLIAQLSGVMNALGWMLVGVYFVLMLGYGYFYFLKPDTA